MSKKPPIDAEKTNAHIVSWLKSYALNAHASGFVVGISGGVDSAVVSALCAQTGLKTLCVELPIHQPESHVNRGREHIAWLGEKFLNVSAQMVNLTPVFDAFSDQVPAGTGTAAYNLSLANSRARLRMTTLYYLGGIHGLLVAGTGNKVEDFGVGFFTKYGDGGVDLSPIADLMKSEVYALGEYLGIPMSIIEAVPADGLFDDNRSDEDQIGASYDELEWAMTEFERGKTATDFTGRQKLVMEIFADRHEKNLHKMVPVPVCYIPTNCRENFNNL